MDPGVRLLEGICSQYDYFHFTDDLSLYTLLLLLLGEHSLHPNLVKPSSHALSTASSFINQEMNLQRPHIGQVVRKIRGKIPSTSWALCTPTFGRQCTDPHCKVGVPLGILLI